MESFIIIIIIMVCRMVQVSLGINKTRTNTKYIPLIIVIVIKITYWAWSDGGCGLPTCTVMADCIILSSDSEKCISDKDDDLPSFSAFLKTNRAIHSSKSSKTTAQSSRTVCLVDETESEQSQTLTEEDEEELDPKVAKRRRLEKEKEERKMERERKKAEKQREKTVHKMVSQVSMHKIEDGESLPHMALLTI